MPTAERLKQWNVPTAACRSPKCERPVLFIFNTATGAGGPVDPKAVVYAVHRPDAEGRLSAVTAAKFLDSVASITLKDGSTVDPADLLGFFVSHFATCPDAHKF